MVLEPHYCFASRSTPTVSQSRRGRYISSVIFDIHAAESFSNEPGYTNLQRPDVGPSEPKSPVAGTLFDYFMSPKKPLRIEQRLWQIAQCRREVPSRAPNNRSTDSVLHLLGSGSGWQGKSDPSSRSLGVCSRFSLPGCGQQVCFFTHDDARRSKLDQHLGSLPALDWPFRGKNSSLRCSDKRSSWKRPGSSWLRSVHRLGKTSRFSRKK